MTIQGQRWVSPSLLARKMLCAAYIPSPIAEQERFRLRALHVMTLVIVIKRYLKSGFRLLALERAGQGWRIDLLFEAAVSARKRLVEVKSGKRMREVHRIQAALYAHKISADEIAVSNRYEDEVLSSEFIKKIQQRAELTRQLITNDPMRSATLYTPHPDVCYTCANSCCPFLEASRNSETRA